MVTKYISESVAEEHNFYTFFYKYTAQSCLICMRMYTFDEYIYNAFTNVTLISQMYVLAYTYLTYSYVGKKVQLGLSGG